MSDIQYRLVLSVRPVVADDGSTQQFLIGDEAWQTKPTDTPPNAPVLGLLQAAGTLRHELFRDRGVAGAIAPSYGAAVLNNAGGELDAWINYGVTGAELELYRGPVGAAFPAGFTKIWRAYAGAYQANSDKITINYTDRLALLQAPLVTEGFDGSGGAEGTGATPKRKQVVIGDPGFFEPILVDRVRQIYFASASATGGQHDAWKLDPTGEVNPFDVYIGAVKVTRADTNYSSRAELESTQPAAGQVRWYFGPDSAFIPGWKDGGCWFRLVGSITGPVRVYGVGYPTDADHARMGGAMGSFFAAHLALRAGVPLADINTAANEMAVDAVLVNDDRTFLDVLNDQAQAVQGWFGFDRLGRFRSGYLLDPESTSPYFGITPGLLGTEPAADSVSTYTFNLGEEVELLREPPSGMSVPVRAVSGTAGECWPCEIANGASVTMRDNLSRQVWTSFAGQAAGTALRDPGSMPVIVNIKARRLQNAFAQRLWLERYLALYAGRRHFWSFRLPLTDELLERDVHDCVTLVYPRFGLAAGKKCRIVARTIDCVSKVPNITFTLWTGSTGRYTGGSTSTLPGGGGSGGSGGGAAFVPPTIGLNSFGAVSGYGYGRITIAGGSPFADVGAVTGFGAGRLLNDPNWAAVSMLVQGGTAASTTITDLSATGGTATIAAGGAWSATQQVFGHNMIRCTSNTMDAAPFTSTGGASRFTRAGGQALTIECYLYLVTVENVSRAAQLWYWANGAIGRVAELFVQGTSRTLTMRLESASEVTYGTLAANTLHFLQLVVATDDTFSLRVNGTEVGTGTFPVDTYAGTHDFYVGSNPTADGATTTADYYLSPLRWTLGVERAGGVPAAEFPVG